MVCVCFGWLRVEVVLSVASRCDSGRSQCRTRGTSRIASCSEEFWDADDEALARMEAREDAALGWDSRNEDTFGEHCDAWSFGEDDDGNVEESDDEDSECADAKECAEDWLRLAVASKALPTRRVQRVWRARARLSERSPTVHAHVDSTCPC